MQEPQTVMLSLRYSGPDVEDGTMSAEDIGPVIEGFLSAYIKIVRSEDGEIPRLRHVALGKGSAEISFELLDYLRDTNPLVYFAIFDRIIGLYKWAKGKWPKERTVKEDSYGQPIKEPSVVLENADGETLSIPIKDYEKYKKRLIHSDLKKINAPLNEARVSDWTARAEDDEGNSIESQVNHEERQYFEDASEIQTRETTVIGRLNTITKSTGNGAVYLPNGSRVPFTYVGEDPIQLYRVFSHEGAVKMRCVAHLDENLAPIRLEVSSVEPIQRELGFEDISS